MNKFHQNILSKYKKEGQDWIDNLPKIIESYAKSWHLTHLVEVDNLSYNYVLSGQQGHEEVILKISIESKELKREIAALRGFAEYGAVPIIAYSDNALLLKKAIPGVSLNKNSIKIACDVAKKLRHFYGWYKILKAPVRSFLMRRIWLMDWRERGIIAQQGSIVTCGI